MLKKIITTAIISTALLMGASKMANAGVTSTNQAKVTAVLSSVGLQSTWAQDISLWIKNPGYSKYELESLGHQICASTKHETGFYVITFWHQFGSGQITKVKCS